MTVRRRKFEDPKADATSAQDVQGEGDDFCRGYQDLELLPEERMALEADLSEIHSLLLEWIYLRSR